MDGTPLVDALSQFARNVAKGSGSTDVLHELMAQVTELLVLCGAAVCLVDGRRLRFVSASVAFLEDLERLQERQQVGPSATAVHTRQVVSIPDLATASQAADWPDFAEAAVQAGVRAMVAVALKAEGGPIGALSLYSCQPRAWSPADLRAAILLTEVGASHLAFARALEEQRRAGERLQEALASRIVIEQAKGVLATTHGLTIDEAFALLRKHARDRNARLRDIAGAVVDLGVRLQLSAADPAGAEDVEGNG